MNAILSQRIPDLEGALNFRDLGGYPADGGRTVRWKTVYRSGTTHKLTSTDVRRLDSLGIRFAYDLRSNGERHAQPNRLRDIADLAYRFRDHEDLPGDIRRMMQSPDTGADHMREMMVRVYRQLPYEFADSFRALFQLLTQGDLPLVFNCTAGKDRTGVASALVLTALGVPRETVLDDYLLTDQFFERSCEIILKERDVPLFESIDPAVWEPLMRVYPSYLNAMFAQLEGAHGSVLQFLYDRLDMNAERLERLRANLLE
jgi:protein-tyrosine phosphatase